MTDNGDYSQTLTDLSLAAYRNREPRLLLNVRRNGATSTPLPAKERHYSGLISILSKALDERLARKLTRHQYKTIRNRTQSAIRRME